MPTGWSTAQHSTNLAPRAARTHTHTAPRRNTSWCNKSVAVVVATVAAGSHANRSKATATPRPRRSPTTAEPERRECSCRSRGSNRRWCSMPACTSVNAARAAATYRCRRNGEIVLGSTLASWGVCSTTSRASEATQSGKTVRVLLTTTTPQTIRESAGTRCAFHARMVGGRGCSRAARCASHYSSLARSAP